MEKSPELNTSEYLDRINESDIKLPETEDEQMESLGVMVRLSKPFENVINKDTETEVIDLGKSQIEIGSTMVSDKDDDFYGYRKINKLILSSEEHSIDLISDIPNMCEVYIETGLITETGAVLHLGDREVIVIRGEIKSIKMLAILFHEIGHVIDKMSENKSLMKDSFTEDNAGKIAEEIRSERAASAFALKTMRRLITDEQTKNDIISFLKDDNLATYYHFAREKISKLP